MTLEEWKKRHQRPVHVQENGEAYVEIRKNDPGFHGLRHLEDFVFADHHDLYAWLLPIGRRK